MHTDAARGGSKTNLLSPATAPDDGPFTARVGLVGAVTGQPVSGARVTMYAKASGTMVSTGVSNTDGEAKLTITSVATTMATLLGPGWREEALEVRAAVPSRGLSGASDVLVPVGGRGTTEVVVLMHRG